MMFWWIEEKKMSEQRRMLFHSCEYAATVATRVDLMFEDKWLMYILLTFGCRLSDRPENWFT